MNQSPELLIQSVKEKIDYFQVKLNNRRNDLDYYTLSESLLIRLLNPLFNCDLKNANQNEANAAGIDLADETRKISFQVTYQNDLEKIKSTLIKVGAHHAGKFNEVYVICLVKKQNNYSQSAVKGIDEASRLNFMVNKHILDLSDLASRVKFLASEPEKLRSMDKHLDEILSGFNNLSQSEDRAPTPLENFIHVSYIDSRYFKSYLDDDLLHKYSELFSYISFYQGPVEERIAEHDTIFGACFEHIMQADSENPLAVAGLSGSGKSTFLSLLYKYFVQRLSSSDSLHQPLYINLQKYFGAASEEESVQKLKYDIGEMNRLIDGKKNLILIIDGYDDIFQYIITRANRMIDIILTELKCRKKIIGVNISDNSFIISREQNNKYNFATDADSRISLQPASINDKNFGKFINLYAEIRHYYKSDNGTPAGLALYLKEKLHALKVSRVDLFLLFLLYSKRTVAAYDQSRQLSDFYQKYCQDKLKDVPGVGVFEASDVAFEFYIKKKREGQYHRDVLRLINSHWTIRDFLLAFQIVSRLKAIGDNNAKGLKNRDSFNFVYTDGINNFCKEIMNNDPRSQRLVYEAIKKTYKSVSLTAKTHFCYLLGRFVAEDIKSAARTFLLEQLDKVNNSRQDGPENQVLLYHRTIYISLIYLGHQPSNDEYLHRLFTDKKWDSINRGFHREYYGDIPYDPDFKSLTYEDAVEDDFSKTCTKLHTKLADATERGDYYNLFEVELHTLCSLAQHRQFSPIGKIDAEQLRLVADLTKAVLERFKKITNKNLRKYIEFIAPVFREGRHFSPGKFIADVYAIKERDRTGWRKRGIEPAEKVSSHIYGAYLIGKICLPETLRNYPSYNKSRILEMILIHDLGEAITGDIMSDSKTADDKELEEKAIEGISILGTYFNNELFNLDQLYKDFERRDADDINVKIANELDKLDNLMQLHIYYYDQQLPVYDFDTWKEKLVSAIKSDEGKKIKTMILDYFAKKYDL